MIIEYTPYDNFISWVNVYRFFNSLLKFEYNRGKVVKIYSNFFNATARDSKVWFFFDIFKNLPLLTGISRVNIIF